MLMISFFVGILAQSTEISNKFGRAANSIIQNVQTDVYLNLCCHKKHLR